METCAKLEDGTGLAQITGKDLPYARLEMQRNAWEGAPLLCSQDKIDPQAPAYGYGLDCLGPGSWSRSWLRSWT